MLKNHDKIESSNMEFINCNQIFLKLQQATFNECKDLLKNKNTIVVFKEFLLNELDITDILKNDSIIKKILLSFIIKYHTNDILGEINNDIKKNLYNYSCKIIVYFLQQNKNRKSKDYMKDIQNYLDLFKEWKEIDLFNLIGDLTKMYWELDLKKKIEYSNNDISIKNINKKQDIIKKKILSIGGNKGLEYFNKYQPILLSEDYFNSLFKKITDTYHQAYWDNIYLEIKNENYKSLLDLLLEAKQFFIAFNPKDNNYIEEINENIDIEFIKQQLDHKIFDLNNISNLLIYLIVLLESNCNTSDLQSIRKWKLELKNEFLNKEIDLPLIFPNFFIKLFKYIINIKNNI